MSTQEPSAELFLPELVEFIHGGVATFIGSSNAALEPEATRGFGPRVSPDRRTLDVFVGRRQSCAFLTNVAAGRPLAVTLGNVLDYRSVQVKGQGTACRDADGDDIAWVEHYWWLFERCLAQVGLPPEQVMQLRCRDLVRVTLLPGSLFRQTPGPGAGDAVAGGAPWP